MMATAKQGRVATLIRMPEALFEAVRERAFRERRSINALLVEAVQRYMDRGSHAPHGSTGGADASLKERLLHTIDELDRRNRNLGLVPIPAIRQAMTDVSREAFDRLLLGLAARRELTLVWHDKPSVLSPEERAGCIEDGGRVFYWVRWGM